MTPIRAARIPPSSFKVLHIAATSAQRCVVN
jgi:hypothetical protein